MSAARAIWSAVAVMAIGAGCARQAPAFDRQESARHVSRMLYGDNLIADPAVNAQVGRFVLAVDRDGARPDSVLREMDKWLQSWAAAHPGDAARARLMPRSTPPPDRAGAPRADPPVPSPGTR